MKKILSVILIFSVLMVSLVACGTGKQTDDTTTTPPVTTTEPTTVATTTEEPTPTTEVTEPVTEPVTDTTTVVTEPPAPEYPAAIKSAEDFAAMNPDGEYYLANDITIDATWNNGEALKSDYTLNVPFTGILDGKGYTITTTTALFASFSGTVTNLTVAGEIAEAKVSDTVLHGAAVALWTNGEAYFENVTNKANVLNGASAGGILGYGATGSVVTMVNCVNDGDINCTGQAGGIVGYVQDNSISLTDCVNNGTITTTNYGAGIIGRFGRDAASVANGSLITMTGCINNGKVVSGKSQSGGMIGYLIGMAEITNCVNNGEIINENGVSGGILGSPAGKDSLVAFTIDGCINNGTIRGTAAAGGITGRQGYKVQDANHTYTVKNCINTGDIYGVALSGTTGTLYVAGISGYAYGGSLLANGVYNCINTGNVYLDSTGTTGDAYAAGIVSYVNAANFEAKNNISTGNITCTGTTVATALVIYNKNGEPVGLSNNYGLAIGETAAVAVNSPAVALETAGAAVTAEQLASGEVAYLINEAAGETIYYQNIGIDAVPTLTKSEDAVVYKWENGAYANVATATPITTAEEFAAMTADGAYYLANDITIAASWNGGTEITADYATNVAFTGYFDGMGHTITTTAPMFANFAGTIKNLTVAGDITVNTIGETAVHAGAISRWTNGTATFANITNKANISGSKSTGALVGYGATGSNIVAVNCVNDGNFDCSDQVGGMFGYIQDDTVTIINCVNNGTLNTANYGGGIIGRFGRDAADHKAGSLVTIIGCINNGKVTSAKGQTGGILGYLIGGAEIYDCVNYGEIDNTTAQSGGIFGSTGDKSGTTTVYIENCTNYGTIIGVTYVGGIAARVGRAAQSTSGNYRVVNCVNYGEIRASVAKDASIYAAGIIAYGWGGSISDGQLPNGTVGNINYGKITVDATAVTSKANYIAGIIGYVNSGDYEIKDNVNAGEIAVTGGAANTIALIGYNKAIGSVENGMFANNYALAAGETVVAYAGDGEAMAPAADTAAVTFTAEQLAAGEISYLKDIDFQLK